MLPVVAIQPGFPAGTFLATSLCPDPVLTTGLRGPAGRRHPERKHGVPECTPGLLVLPLMTIFRSQKQSPGWEQSSETKLLVTESGWHMDGHQGLLSRSFKTTSNGHQSKFQRTRLRFSGCSPIKYSGTMTAYTPVLGIFNGNLSDKREARAV